MKAIIPVAGHGTRLQPFTNRVQKCLLPVAGKPVLSHIIDPLIDLGIDEITLIVGHLGNQVKAFSEIIPQAKFSFRHQKERLGLGHAVNMALENQDEPVLVILGDSIFGLNYEDFIAAPNNVIGVREVDDPRRFGVIEIDGGKISRLVEKPENPPSNLAIAGVYFFRSEKRLKENIDYLVENDIRTRNEYQLTDAMQRMLETGDTFNYYRINQWLDCGVPATILETNHILLGDGNQVSPDAVVEDSQLISCHISSGCVVKNCRLENVIMLENTHLEGQTLSNCILDATDKIIL